MVDSTAHVHPCGTYIHVHTQLPHPTWKNRGLCACEHNECLSYYYGLTNSQHSCKVYFMDTIPIAKCALEVSVPNRVVPFSLLIFLLCLVLCSVGTSMAISGASLEAMHLSVSLPSLY